MDPLDSSLRLEVGLAYLALGMALGLDFQNPSSGLGSVGW